MNALHAFLRVSAHMAISNGESPIADDSTTDRIVVPNGCSPNCDSTDSATQTTQIEPAATTSTIAPIAPAVSR